jgi:hypothetical protein
LTCRAPVRAPSPKTDGRLPSGAHRRVDAGV